MPDHFVEPVAALMNVSRYVAGDYSGWVPVSEQVLGRITSPRTAPPVSYELRLPVSIDGASVDVDNDGAADAGVQVYALFIGSNLTGDSYLEQMDQAAYRSYIADPATGAFREGTLLVKAPDDAQGFPSGAGPDGVYFTPDDPVVGLPAGYTRVTLGRDGRVSFDRPRIATMDTLEETASASPDFSGQGILESFDSLIDLLKQRYAYTELRNLDWDRIGGDFRPRVEAADRAGDFVDFYLALTELAISIRDAHVFADSADGATKGAYWSAMGEQFGAGVGARGTQLDDGRYVITDVVPGGPAAGAGWQAGTEIVTVNGEPMAERIARLPVSGSVGTAEAAHLKQVAVAMGFPEGIEVAFGYRLPGEEEVRSVKLVPVRGLQFPQGGVQAGRPFSFRELEGGYGYVTWGLFREPQYMIGAWERFLQRFQGAPGIVIDLRDNGGGNAELMYTMASYFFSADKPASYHWLDEYRFDDATGGLVQEFPMDRPLYAPKAELDYGGAVVVLVDQNTASAGEYFPQYHDRALVVGEHTSEGAGGSLERVAMPGNIRFAFTKGRTYFAGTTEVNLEARGVTLDVRVPITEDNERAKVAGRDPVLEAAMDALARESAKIAGARLSGTRWQLVQIGAAPGAPVQPAKPPGYTIAFNPDGSMDIATDCNRVKADYQVGAGGVLAITPTVSTLASCPAHSIGDEFVSWLGASRTFQISDDGLGILTDPESGVIVLLFTASPD